MKTQPLLIPVAGLVFGILFSDLTGQDGQTLTVKLLFLVFILIILLFGYLKRFAVLFTFLGFTVFSFFLTERHNKWEPMSDNYIGIDSLLELKIDETFRSSEKFRKYKAKILTINKRNVNEEFVLLYWSKLNKEIFPGDEILVQSTILPLQKPLNPYQFDYSKYLNRRKIHYMIYQNQDYQQIKISNSLRNKASVFKNFIHNKMIENGYKKSTADLVGAMLLGDRTEMDPEIENDFRRTGVVHLLAISGLHVMMVYSIFMILLYPLRFLRNGKTIRILMSLLLIWSFVSFVDFRPPVFRSALMISIYYIIILLTRKPNIYHTLLFSSFVLLIYNPNFLFDPGFLLSYSAVFFIVYFNPVYRKIFRPKTTFSKNAVGFLGTTVSAQMGTLPLTVFYFNQTSGLFLAGNVVMIAASYLMVGGGMLTVLLVGLGLDFNLWRTVFDSFISLCNSYLHWLAQYDNLVFDRLSLSGIEVILLIFGFLLLKILFNHPKAKIVFVFLALIFVFEVQRIYRIEKLNKKEEIIVFHQPGKTVIGVRKAFLMDVFMSDTVNSSQIEQYILKPYGIHQKIKRQRIFDLNTSALTFYTKTNDFIELNGNRLVFYNQNSELIINEKDFVLIRNNTIADSVSVHVNLVTDGSNYPGFHTRISHPKIWNTASDGALIIE